jgi:hypothetical protein
MTVGQKFLLGPLKSRPCSGCQRNVSVHACALLAQLPFLLGIAIAIVAWPAPSAVLAALVGTGLMSLLHQRYVPLVPRAS